MYVCMYVFLSVCLSVCLSVSARTRLLDFAARMSIVKSANEVAIKVEQIRKGQERLLNLAGTRASDAVTQASSELDEWKRRAEAAERECERLRAQLEGARIEDTPAKLQGLNQEARTRLRELKLFVLDNSLRESTVGQVQIQFLVLLKHAGLNFRCSPPSLLLPSDLVAITYMNSQEHQQSAHDCN